MWLDPELRTVLGGHQVQMDETAHALRRLGHEVVVSLETSPELDGYDVVHGLGLSPQQVRRARLARLPVVMSTIWWPVSYRQGKQMPWNFYRLRNTALRSAHRLKDAMLGRPPEDAWLGPTALAFESSMVLLPNGPGEAAAVKVDTRVTTPFMTIPNGVHPERFSPSDMPREDFILIAGRVEPLKNQLGAIKALRATGRQIVVAGPAHPQHLAYFEQCRRALGTEGTMIGRVSQDDLVPLYRRASVHVLASWFETTGLVSLEAAACGAPIVTTDRGFARDYFGDRAAYCDPSDPVSIRRAVGAAIANTDPTFSAFVRSRYTWQRAALRTEMAYRVARLEAPESELTEQL